MPIASINPATGETLKTFEALTALQIEQKLALAVTTFHAELKTPFAERARRMRKATAMLSCGRTGAPVWGSMMLIRPLELSTV